MSYWWDKHSESSLIKWVQKVFQAFAQNQIMDLQQLLREGDCYYHDSLQIDNKKYGTTVGEVKQLIYNTLNLKW